MRRFLRIFGFSLLGLLFIIIIALAIIPGQVVKYVNENGQELIGRSVAVKDIDVSYLNLYVKIDSFVIMEANDTAPFVSFDSLKVDLELQGLFRSQYNVEYTTLSGLYVYVETDDGKFNFDDIIEKFTSDSTQEQEVEEPAEPLEFALHNTTIEHANFVFRDIQAQNRLKANNVYFNLPSFSWDNQQTHSDLSFDFPRGGGITANFDFNVEKKDFEVQVAINKMYLRFLYPYLKDYVNISELNGSFSNSFTVKGNIDSLLNSQVSGYFNLQDIYFKDLDSNKFFALDSLGVTLDSIDLKNRYASISSVNIHQPWVSMFMDQSGVSLEKLVRENPDTSTTQLDEKNDGPDWTYLVNNIVLNEGGVLFEDRTAPQTFAYELSSMKLESSPVKNDMNEIRLVLTQKLGGKGRFTSHLNYSLTQNLTFDADLHLKGLWLPDFSPYSNPQIGNNIDGGALEYKADIVVDSGIIVSEHEAYFAGFDLSKRINKDAQHNLPVNLALALLKDKDGNIDLDYTIEGDMNDPAFNANGLFWGTLGNIVIKTAAAPGKFLGQAIGGDSAHFNNMEFDKFQRLPNSQHQKQLEKIKQALDQKPGLMCELVYFSKDSALAADLAYGECTVDYYLLKKPGKSGKELSQKDSLNLVKISQSPDFATYLLETSQRNDLKPREQALAIKGLSTYQNWIDSMHQVQVNGLEAFMYTDLGSDSTQIKIVDSGQQSEVEKVIYQLQFAARED